MSSLTPCLPPTLLSVPTTSQVPSLLHTSLVFHVSPHSPPPHLQGSLAWQVLSPLDIYINRNSIQVTQVENYGTSDLAEHIFFSHFKHEEGISKMKLLCQGQKLVSQVGTNLSFLFQSTGISPHHMSHILLADIQQGLRYHWARCPCGIGETELLSITEEQLGQYRRPWVWMRDRATCDTTFRTCSVSAAGLGENGTF